MWRSDAWWVHNRKTDELSIISTPEHPWLKDLNDDELSITSNASFLPQLETFTVPESESDASHAKKVDKIKSAGKRTFNA